MILFKSKDQFLLLPAIGFVRDGNAVMLNISWMMFGVVICFLYIEEKTNNSNDENNNEK